MERKMLKTILITFILLPVISCDKTNKSIPKENRIFIQEKSRKLDNKELPEKLLTLATEPKTDDEIGDIEENLFGKFFCDRAEFYIIKNPVNQIYSTSAESITLYYLDSELCQTKYILNNDIKEVLIKQWGDFKILGLDYKNRDVIKTGEILIKTTNGWTLNERLNNYELKWTIRDKEIKYRVKSDKFGKKFMYLEKSKDYEREFKQIEKHCV
jgi:hypothetical protein